VQLMGPVSLVIVPLLAPVFLIGRVKLIRSP
jgi:hypothetical protein